MADRSVTTATIEDYNARRVVSQRGCNLWRQRSQLFDGETRFISYQRGGFDDAEMMMMLRFYFIFSVVHLFYSRVFFATFHYFRFIAFDKERLHSAVSIENFGLSIHGHQFGPP